MILLKFFINNISHFVAISMEWCCFDVCSCTVLFPFESFLTIQTGWKFPCRILHSLTSFFVLVMLWTLLRYGWYSVIKILIPSLLCSRQLIFENGRCRTKIRDSLLSGEINLLWKGILRIFFFSDVFSLKQCTLWGCLLSVPQIRMA